MPIMRTLNYQKKIEYFSKNNIKIKKIECGDYFSLALSTEGKLYAWGKNNYGQLGLGRLSSQLKIHVPNEIVIENNKKVTNIFSGEDHCSCTTEDEEGYIWGYGMDGRLGNKIKTNMNIPTKINIGEKIIKIACGGHHTAILSKNGTLYMCGNGRDGELGRGDRLESVSVIRDEPIQVIIFLIFRSHILN